MPPRIIPSLPEIERFATPLNDGERLVLARLEVVLDDRWTVYVQPHLLNMQPDFLLLSQDHGVTIIEVKDWGNGLYRSAEGQITVRDTQGNWQRSTEDPLDQANRYRNNIAEKIVSPPDSDLFTSVRACVVLPRWMTAEAQTLLREGTCLPEEKSKWIRIVGMEFLDPNAEDSYRNHVRWGGTRPGRGLADAPFHRLRARLEEPEAIADQRLPLRLSDGARNVALNPSNATIRRVRGPAGCGKTLGLAARAATLAGENKDVLVVTFNITLAHYVQDLVRRHARQIGADHRRVDCIHLHGFCQPFSQMMTGEVGSEEEHEIEKWDEPIVAATKAYASGLVKVKRYDAILVDEGQDFKQSWWNFLREHVRKGPASEMVLAADAAQDIYERNSWVDEESMRGCGFSGPWTDLRGSYRLPVDLSPILAEFVSLYLPPNSTQPSVPSDHNGVAAEPTIRRWVNVAHSEDDEVARTVSQEVKTILEHDGAPSAADVAILVNEHELGMKVTNACREAFGTIEHIFAESKADQRRRKARFWPGVATMKACTVHSFKGWEARAVVVVIGSGRGHTASAVNLGYVALSRVKGDPVNRAAFVTVINLEPTLNSFQSRFERQITSEEAPGLAGQRQLPL